MAAVIMNGNVHPSAGSPSDTVDGAGGDTASTPATKMRKLSSEGREQEALRTTEQATGDIKDENDGDVLEGAEADGALPTKPATAYTLFIRSQQEEIKGDNPNASFAEISRLATAAWASLDPTKKASFKVMAEKEKQEYLKVMSARKRKNLRLSTSVTMAESEDDDDILDQVDGSGGGGEKIKKDEQPVNDDDDDLVWDAGPDVNGQSSNANNDNEEDINELADISKHTAPSLCCSRFGCQNHARASSEWDNEFCSSDCVVKHCKFVFDSYFTPRDMSI